MKSGLGDHAEHSINRVFPPPHVLDLFHLDDHPEQHMSDQTITTAIDTIRHRWHYQQVPLRPGATDAETTEFETRHGVLLPEGVRQLTPPQQVPLDVPVRID